MDATPKAHGARHHATWAAAIIDALGAQSVVVAGTDAVFIAETLKRSFDTGAHLASHIRAYPSDQTLGHLDQRRVRLPRRQQEIQTRHVLLRLRLAALRPRLKGLLRPQDHPGQSALGQAVIALAHRRILTLHAMTRDATPYDPQPAPKLATAA